MGWGKSVGEAEAKLDRELSNLGVGAGLTVGQSEELASTVKQWVRAYVAQEKDDLRDEIKQRGEWDPSY